MIPSDRSSAQRPSTTAACWRTLIVLLGVLTTLAGPASGQRRGGSRTPDTHPRPTRIVEAQPQILQGEDSLTRVYDAILAARFADLDTELRRACGPAPIEACHVLEATALWWRIQLDPESRALDDEFSSAVERAITSAEAWTVRSPEAGEAWFYLGGAYAARVQWRVLRDEKLAAARDGKRIKDALERALELEPGLDDAYFGIGMYRYYADVAPAAARFLRFLLLLPGGDREDGLAQMLRARARGHLLQGEADYQLHIIYLWYERQTDRALELLQDLQRRYPENPLFPIQIAEIQDAYLHDLTASGETWRRLLALARGNRVNVAGLAEVRARLGIASVMDRLAETDDAIDQLEQVIALKPDAPDSSLPLAYLRLGEAHDRMNARADAMAAYRLASLSAPERDHHNVRRQATERLRKAPNARHAEAYRLSLEGWRKLEQKDVKSAAAALEQALALNPHDPVAHYRYARTLHARHDEVAALRHYELTIRDAQVCPAPIVGSAYLEAARLHERAGRRDQALSAYRVASTLFGAAGETHRAALRAVERLQK